MTLALGAGRTSADAASFLAQVSKQLAESLDYQTTLQSVARLPLPYLADWCVVDILDDDASIQRVAMAHVDPAFEGRLQSVAQRHTPGATALEGVPKVLRSGRGELIDAREQLDVHRQLHVQGQLYANEQRGLAAGRQVDVREQLHATEQLDAGEQRGLAQGKQLDVAEQLHAREQLHAGERITARVQVDVPAQLDVPEQLHAGEQLHAASATPHASK